MELNTFATNVSIDGTLAAWAGVYLSEDFTISSESSPTLTNGLSAGSVSNTFTVNTNTSSAGSSLCTCFSATGIGTVNNCPVHGTSTVVSPGITFIPVTPTYPATSPNYTFTWPSPVVEMECYICQDKLEMDDMAANKKVCKDCRRAVETFKQVLVHEETEE